MNTLFISDLHLDPARPELIELACQFLQQQTQDISALYILGDVFNTWLGDDLVPDEYQPFITELQQLKQRGVNTYLMVGNRDFMVGKAFAEHAGSQLLTDPSLIELNGVRTLVMHGDSLCTDDVSYQRYRRWVRNPLLQWCFLSLPLRFRQRISDKIKQKSRQQKQSKTAMIMDVNQQEVLRVMQQYEVSLLIHGHTHRPAIHQLDSGNAHRVVLGDWGDDISFARFDGHQLEIIDHRLAKKDSHLRVV